MDIKEIIKKPEIAFIGYFISWGLSLVLFGTVLWAYFFNNYHFGVNINLFGEAHIELCTIIVVFVFITYGLCLNIDHLRKVRS